MLRKSDLAIVPLVLAAACGSPPPPAEAPAPGSLAPAPAPPVYALIGHRQALELTSEQITALDSIGQQLSAENEPLTRQIRESRGTRPARPGAPLVLSEEGRTLLEQVRANNRRAMEGVRALLTPEQQAQTCVLFRESDRQRMQRTGRTGPGARQPRDARRGGQAEEEAMMQRSVWPWCGAAAEQDSSSDGT